MREKDYVQRLILLGWFGYFTAYLGRLNYSACMVQIISDLAVTKESAGLVLSLFYFSYGVGQFVYGTLIERLNVKKTITIVMIASALINLAIPFAGSIGFIQVLWFLNGAVQSALWAGIIKLFTTYIPQKQMYHAIVIIHTTGAAGTLAVYLLAAVSVAFFSWKIMFTGAGIALLLMSIIWYRGMGRVEEHLPVYQQVAQQEQSEEHTSSQHWNGVLGLLLASGTITAFFAAIANGALRDGVTLWTPSFLHERFGSGVALSILSTLILPLFSLAGSYCARFVNRRIPSTLYTASFFFVLSMIATVGVTFLGSSFLSASIFFGIITCSMSAVNTLIVSVLPMTLRAHTDKTATIAGLTNAFCYVGSTSASYVFGALARHFGWNSVLYVLLGIAVVSALLCAMGGKRYQRFTAQYGHTEM